MNTVLIFLSSLSIPTRKRPQVGEGLEKDWKRLLDETVVCGSSLSSAAVKVF